MLCAVSSSLQGCGIWSAPGQLVTWWGPQSSITFSRGPATHTLPQSQKQLVSSMLAGAPWGTWSSGAVPLSPPPRISQVMSKQKRYWTPAAPLHLPLNQEHLGFYSHKSKDLFEKWHVSLFFFFFGLKAFRSLLFYLWNWNTPSSLSSPRHAIYTLAYCIISLCNSQLLVSDSFNIFFSVLQDWLLLGL